MPANLINLHHRHPGCKMEVSFFKRRKILKKTSALELIPVRLMECEPREEGKVDILLPRFKNRWLVRAMEPLNRKQFIRIKLDAFGSATWLLIDGKRNVAGISAHLNEDSREKLTSAEETLERVNQFMTMLYQQRFITFQQIQKHDKQLNS
ncbi:MAG: hypothetical protein V1733_06780 [bacterium]